MTTQEEKIKPKPCELCGVDDGKTQMHCGGVATWSHEECSKIGCKAIKLYLRKYMWIPRGLQYLAHHIMEIYEEMMEEEGFVKVDGDWQKKEE